MMAKTLFDKIWRDHEVSDGLLYIDLHLVHEVTSPQAFDGLRLAGRKVRRPDRTIATVDHNVPTDNIVSLPQVSDPLSRRQIEVLEENCSQFGVPIYSIGSEHQGIVHVIGPELGITQPGMTIVCGDSHTSTHGAFGALAFGIGTSEVEHVLATQTLPQRKPKSMRINYQNKLADDVTAKDLILYTIGRLGVSGMSGYVNEYAGPAIEALTMEERMTICNMSIEGGARAGMIAPDEQTFAFLEGRPGFTNPELIDRWRLLPTEEGAKFDREEVIDAAKIRPMVSWGTTPGQVVPVDGAVPEPQSETDERALAYMDLIPGQVMQEIKIDRAFLGSCTNARLPDLRAAARVVEGKRVASHVRAMVVPGSASVKAEAEREGLDKIFQEAGFEWRSAGCSMCLGMNPDYAAPGERVASSSNRNFEGRQGRGARTHLMSPQLVAASAISGHLSDARR